MNKPQDRNYSFSNLCNSGEYASFVSADRDSNRKGDSDDDGSHKKVVDIFRKTDDFMAILDHGKRFENAGAFSSLYTNFGFHNTMKRPVYHLPPLDMSLTPLPSSSSSDLKRPALKKPPATVTATSQQFVGNPTTTAMFGSSPTFASTDWLQELGEHVELDDYHIFNNEEIDFKHDSTSCRGTSSTKTNATPSKVSVPTEITKVPSSQKVVGSEEPGTASSLSPDCPKSIGEVSTETSKVYVDAKTANDVLFGQGSESNLHPGNFYYRIEVANYQDLYKNTTDMKMKKDCIQCVIDFVKAKGRFLRKDKATNSWYVAPDRNVWKKVSQALRENNDIEHRRAKRARYKENKKKSNK